MIREWLPIETAPKDGTSVDLWIANYIYKDRWREPDCYWSDVFNEWRTHDGGKAIKGSDVIEWWMQLPDDPPRKGF